MTRSLRDLIIMLAVPSIAVATVALHVLQIGASPSFTLAPGQKSLHIMSPLPSDRVAQNADSWLLKSEPVYFSVFPPYGTWEHVAVDVAFDPGTQPLIELGILGSLELQSFTVLPAWNALIPKDWVVTPREEGALFTRPGASTDISTLSRDRLRVARTSVDLPYDASRARLTAQSNTLPFQLLGAHELYVAAPEGDLVTRITVTDQNLVRGSDEGALRIIDAEGSVLAEHVWGDDGNVSDDGKRAADRKIELRTRIPSEGVYKIALSSTSDIRFSSVATNVVQTVIAGRAHFADCPDVFVTNGSRVTFEPRNVDAFGTPHVGSNAVKLQKIGEKQSLALADARSTVLDCTGDMIVSTEGVIAASSAAFFPATLLPLTISTNLADVDAIVARTADTRTDADGTVHARVIFDLAGVPLERGAYRLMISAPGVTEGRGVHVRSVTTTFTRSTPTTRNYLGIVKRYLYDLLP